MILSDFEPFLGPLGLQTLAGLGIGVGLLWIYRRMRARFPVGAAIFAAGLLLRAGIGVTLFWISWLDLPVLRDLHMGNGFWTLAPDAVGYMSSASRVAIEGLDTIQPGSASPSYVATVALFMRLVGISPFTGMYLNLVVYSVLCASLVLLWRPKNDWRADLPLLLLLAALSFSPVQIIHGSQSLKDDVFAFVTAVGAIGALVIVMVAAYGLQAVRSPWAIVAGAVCWLGAVFIAAGIRAYFALFMLCSLTAVLALFGLRPRIDTLYRRVPALVMVCSVTAWAYMSGAGVYDVYLRPVLSVVWSPSTDSNDRGLFAMVTRRIAASRAGFERSGGGTNVAAGLSSAEYTQAPDGIDGPVSSARSRMTITPDGPVGYVRRLALGLGTLFVPISILQALSITNLPGGRGLLFVTDIDTLFADTFILASLALLYLRWDRARRRLPFVCYLLLLGTVTALLLAYVVTNFGTQFRLRLLAVLPFWLLLLATADDGFIPAAPHADRASEPAPPGTSG